MAGGTAQAPGEDSPAGPRRRLLVLCFDPLTEAMPGPAIRAWFLGCQLAADHEVVLAGTAGVTRSDPAMSVRSVEASEIPALVDWADAVFAPTSVVRRHPAVTAKPLCIDMYIPTHLENLEPSGPAGGDDHAAAVAHQVSVINDDLRHGDFFLCASERQRDLWLGSLAALGRVNPATYRSDPALRSLIDVVPFGLDPAAEPPAWDASVVSRSFPAIGPGDPVVIWGGGVYNWFDPLTVLHAVARVAERRPAVRLVFLGMRNPNPGIPAMRVAEELEAESDRLGLTGRTAFFNEGWVPYAERGGWLARADVAVSTHRDHLETRFSFRTRVLDYLWAGVPMVLTGGDTVSDEVAAAGFGITVGPGDVPAVAAAIERLLDQPPDRVAVREFGRRYAWDAVAAPLRRWATGASRAPDRLGNDEQHGADAGRPREGSVPPDDADTSAAPAAVSRLGTSTTSELLDELAHRAGRRLPPSWRRRLRRS